MTPAPLLSMFKDIVTYEPFHHNWCAPGNREYQTEETHVTDTACIIGEVTKRWLFYDKYETWRAASLCKLKL